MAELTEEISKELREFTIEEKMRSSQSLMSLHATSSSWTTQKKFEFHYGQYRAYQEILSMLKNM